MQCFQSVPREFKSTTAATAAAAAAAAAVAGSRPFKKLSYEQCIQYHYMCLTNDCPSSSWPPLTPTDLPILDTVDRTLGVEFRHAILTSGAASPCTARNNGRPSGWLPQCWRRADSILHICTYIHVYVYMYIYIYLYQRARHASQQCYCFVSELSKCSHRIVQVWAGLGLPHRFTPSAKTCSKNPQRLDQE